MLPSPEKYSSADLDRWASLDSMEGLIAIESREAPPPKSLLARIPGGKLIDAVYPGLLVAVTIALAATFLSTHYNTPVMLFGLLFGMAFHFLHEDGRCVAGIEFSSRTILRLGVALLGVRVTASQIISLGIMPVATVIVGVGSTILIGSMVAKRLGLGKTFGVLSGGAVAICGASAALAIASVLPKHENSERDTILTVVSVTALSTLAMIFYPILVGWIGFDHVHAGVFLGGTIHDVAQVIGAGFMISPETGDVATYVKLLRVAMLLPVVSIIASTAASGEGKSGLPKVPTFLIGFAGLVAINSTGLLPAFVVSALTEISRWCLVTAIAALGMKTSFKSLIVVGWRPVGLMVIETAWIAVLVLLSVKFLV
jgi:uncharacterized integral membrane protein (TIGR00698 family)